MSDFLDENDFEENEKVNETVNKSVNETVNEKKVNLKSHISK